MTPSLQAAGRLVVKDGLRPGFLGDAERQCALAIVWAALGGRGQPSVRNEREISLACRSLLQGNAASIDTDPVELRRWPVDSGWLVRDGFGRAYRPTAPEQLLPAQAGFAAALGSVDVVASAGELRQARRSHREARREAWLAKSTASAA